MTDEAYKPVVEYAIRSFAARCIQHPRLEEDPTCVIATEREKFLSELDKEPPPQEQPKEQPVARNGIHKKGRINHVARTR